MTADAGARHMTASSNEQSSKRALGVAIFLVTAAASPRAFAQDHPEQKLPSGAGAAADGAFLPFSSSARHAERRASAKLVSGYDTAGKSALFRGEAEATLYGPLGFRVGATYDGLSPASRPFVGGFVDVLEQSKYGV